jgi:hypothetical protein
VNNERLAKQVDQGLRRGHYRDPVSGSRLVRELLIAFPALRQQRPVSEKPRFEDLRRRHVR